MIKIFTSMVKIIKYSKCCIQASRDSL